VYRRGQEKPVTVYELIMEDTLEERVLAVQAFKTLFAQAALGKEVDSNGKVDPWILEYLDLEG
jgi:SNF2 family DNA or RNA helicase